MNKSFLTCAIFICACGSPSPEISPKAQQDTSTGGSANVGDGGNNAGSGSTDTSPTATKKALSSGQGLVCALMSDGTAQCLGKISGVSFAYDKTPATTVPGITTAIAIAEGAAHVCAALRNGTVQCFGSNTFGQLGNGTKTDSSTPVQVTGITNATSVSGINFTSCALLSDKTVQCWGNSANGELGNGSTVASSVPVHVNGITSATALSGTCALLNDGSIQCSGANNEGQLGTGTSGSNYASTPVAVNGITSAIAISKSTNNTCALLSGGTVQCWGSNDNEQLGVDNGTVAIGSLPLTISGITGATGVSVGADYNANGYACAASSSGTVQCWGSNGSGQLGNGTTNRSLTPVTASGITNATSVTIGGGTTCALLKDDTITCWGVDLMSTGVQSSIPVQAPFP